MHSHACKLLSLSLLALGACDLKRELVGETLPGAESSGSTGGDATDGAPAGDDSITTTADPTTGAPDGAPCQLGPPEAWEEGVMPDPDAPTSYGAPPIVTPGPTCAGEVCLYSTTFEAPSCQSDADCAGDERLTGICGGSFCNVTQAWGEAHTTCTSRCEADSDCPVLPGCDQGSVCTVLAKLGSLCCQKICACRDDLADGFVEELEWECTHDPQCG